MPHTIIPPTDADNTTKPQKAHTLLTTLIPETLNFHRKPIPAPTPRPQTRAPISPLVTSADVADDTGRDSSAPLAIFGSVSPADIWSHIKALLDKDAEGSRIVLEPENVRIVGLGEGADRIKALGRWEIEISVGARLEPIRKVVEILPLAEDE